MSTVECGKRPLDNGIGRATVQMGFTAEKCHQNWARWSRDPIPLISTRYQARLIVHALSWRTHNAEDINCDGYRGAHGCVSTG
jgi:hypothetical protein